LLLSHGDAAGQKILECFRAYSVFFFRQEKSFYNNNTRLIFLAVIREARGLQTFLAVIAKACT